VPLYATVYSIPVKGQSCPTVGKVTVGRLASHRGHCSLQWSRVAAPSAVGRVTTRDSAATGNGSTRAAVQMTTTAAISWRAVSLARSGCRIARCRRRPRLTALELHSVGSIRCGFVGCRGEICCIHYSTTNLRVQVVVLDQQRSCLPCSDILRSQREKNCCAKSPQQIRQQIEPLEFEFYRIAR